MPSKRLLILLKHLIPWEPGATCRPSIMGCLIRNGGIKGVLKIIISCPGHSLPSLYTTSIGTGKHQG